MPRRISLLRVVLASPSDVQAERDAVESAIDAVNRDTARALGIHLELTRWETDAAPGFHPLGPQALIDPVLRIEDCDLLIGVFSHRFGTVTADGKTGTEHEFDIAYRSWKKSRRPQLMLYFNTKAYQPRSADEADQFGRVQAFRDSFPREGLWWPYSGRARFARTVESHLRRFVHQHRADAAADEEGAGKDPATNAGIARRMLESLNREMDVLGAPRRSRDTFDDHVIFNRIVQGIMVWAHHLLRQDDDFVSGSNIMFLRRQTDPVSGWCFRLHDSDLFFDNTSLVLKVAFSQGRDYYLGQRQFRDFHIFVKEDSPQARLGLNGRTLQELFRNRDGGLRFPLLSDIEDHVLSYNESASLSAALDRKIGYGVRITDNYAFVYSQKQAVGYRSYLSAPERQRIQGIINIPIFSVNPESGRVDRVLGVYNIDIAKPNAISDDTLEQLVFIQRTFNSLFEVFVRKLITSAASGPRL